MVTPPPSAIEQDTVALRVAFRGSVVPAERSGSRATPGLAQYSLLSRLLVCADVCAALLASVSAALVLDGDTGLLAWSLVFLPAWVGIAQVIGLYDRDQRALRHATIDEASSLAAWALVGASLLGLFLVLTPSGPPDALRTVVVGVVAVTSVFGLRALARALWRVSTPAERIAVVGSTATTTALRRKLELFPDLHMTIVEEHDAVGFESEDIAELLARVDRLVYAPPTLPDGFIRRFPELLHAAEGRVTLIPPCADVFSSGVRVNHVAELPVLEYGRTLPSPFTIVLKRAIDIAVSVVSLLLLLPVFGVIAIAIKVDSPGPVFFSQVRAGAGGRPFRMLKFRSMVQDAETLLQSLVSFDRLPEPVFKLQDDPRVTRLGRQLRRWSLDELPQLWNVLVGHMSLVGPRPEQVELVERYSHEHSGRLEIKPGLTGPMQVYGRGDLAFAERLAVERDYIENVSIARDLRIMAMTVPAVLNGRGAH